MLPAIRVLMVGIGPLGRVTGKEIDEAQGRRQLAGYLRFQDEPPHDRLHAALMGTIDELEAALAEQRIDEVYLASTAPSHALAVQSAIRSCERLRVDFALPVYDYDLDRARPVASGLKDGFLHYRAGRRPSAFARATGSVWRHFSRSYAAA